ncbi:Protein ROS1 [Dichanthelium oligosanthes]|uniref:Protein ROS1 n=1 Tax=Dichanthelium oligosanthes TaxID=888268 RepID=A0A1E5VHB9_9POAL|nr:Protein ROS1 [Dichanthelium oligosanthes]
MQESSAQQAALSSPMSSGAEQHGSLSIQPSWNMPAACTQVPINIVVFHRRLTGRGSRPQLPPPHSFMPTPALPDASEGDMTMNPAQLATPDKYNSEHLWPNGLYDEASKGENGTEASQRQQLATTVFRDNHDDLEPVVPGNTLETRVQYSHESTALLAERTADDNMHTYQPMQKRHKTQINQSEHTPLSTPAVPKERTLNQIEMQIAGAEKTKMFRNEETPARKMKTPRKKHRPKVIRENKLAKVQKSDSTPDGKSPNQKVKRSYVRKKRSLSSLEKCSGPASNQSISRGTGIAARSRTASVRRSLQFEPEEQGVQGDHSSMSSLHHHIYETPVHAQSSFCSELEVQIGHGPQVDMENSPGGLAFGMSLRLNKMLDEYIHLPEVTPKPAQEISSATSGSAELAREQDNMGRTCEPDGTSKASLCIKERVVKTAIEGNERDLELNYSDVDGFLSSARSIPEQMSKVSEVENHNDGESSLTGTRDCFILRAAAEMLALCQSGGIKKKRSARVRRNSFYSMMDLENNSLQASTNLPQPCMDALYESSYIKFMTKKRSQKGRLHCSSSIHPNDELKYRFSPGSIFSVGSNGSKISEGPFPNSSPQTLDNERINFDSHCDVPEGISANTTGQYMDYLQGVSSKLKHLDLNIEQVHRTEMHLSLSTPAIISFGGTDGLSNALVPYGGGVMVPYERPLQLVKKRRPRAKVELDFETTRVWNLLMGKASEPDGTDAEKERWWQQERDVFQGRANSFIARMRLVQGDRHFSPWKGSVVDSVVGVFLTQNVADHLSSSAYMALAATFPSRSVNSNCKDDATTQDNEQTISTSALGEKSIFDLFPNGARSDRGGGCEELSMTYEKIHVEPKDNTRASELIEGEAYSFYCKSADGSVCNHQETGIEHKEQQFPDFSSVELTKPTELMQQIQIRKEISSSQSVSLETIQSRLSLSFGIPRNFVGGSSSAAYQQLGSNFDNGRSLTGKDATISEIECQRLQTAAINDYGFGKPRTPSSSAMPFILTVDPQQLNLRNEPNVSSTSSNSPSDSASPNIKNGTSPLFMPFHSYVAEWSGNMTAGMTLNSAKTSTELPGEMTVETSRKEDEYTLKSGFTSYNGVPDTEAQASRPKKTRTTSKKNTENFDWDKLRRQACTEGHMKKRSFERRDSVDWESNFLNRLVRDHGCIDLEWLRDIPPDSAK